MNAVLQDDAALQVSKFFENPLGACMYFAQKFFFSLSSVVTYRIDLARTENAAPPPHRPAAACR